MTDIDWPETLPSMMRLDGLSNTLPGGVIRTEMETGPHKQRPRFTAAPEPLSGSVLLTREQTMIFDSFWSTTLKRGALSFNWTHPRTLQEVEMRFICGDPPGYSPAGEHYVLTMNLEVMP